MNWTALRTLDQIREIRSQSKDQPVLIFKHSTRCNISRTSLDRLERSWKADEIGSVQLYFLDLLSYRDLSNQLAKEFGVEHESPQVLIIKNERAAYDRSHFDISYEQIRDAIKN